MFGWREIRYSAKVQIGAKLLCKGAKVEASRQGCQGLCKGEEVEKCKGEPQNGIVPKKF